MYRRKEKKIACIARVLTQVYIRRVSRNVVGIVLLMLMLLLLLLYCPAFGCYR